VRTDSNGSKGNNRNLRRLQQKQYPDKRQHLDKLFEIAGQKPKNQQLPAEGEMTLEMQELKDENETLHEVCDDLRLSSFS
jgi:hypothetical protein